MKKCLLLLLVCTAQKTFAQQDYWQQQVAYTIDASLNDKENSVTGTETIVYKNNSTSTLDFIWFHIWPNAYKNDSTALFNQLRNDPDRKKKLEKYTYGRIEGLNFKENGKLSVTEPHPNPAYIDIIKVKLSKPLLPGDSTTISTDFKVLLPAYFSRSGYADGEFMICQWYPKPAVFDKDGWHEFPYLDMGEFYSEYASYKVNISVPSDYVVGATGVLQNTDELSKYKTIGARNAAAKEKKPMLYENKTGGTKTLRYEMDNVPDFAWFASKDFVIQYDTVMLPNGKTVDAFTYYHNKQRTLWNYSIDYVKDAVKHYSGWLGNYEYPVVQAIEGPKNNSSGGMEYPTITLITSPDAKKESLDAVIAHEVGHNWFMSMLGTNERAHTWMDEGLNTYFQFRYEAEKYKRNSIFGDQVPKEVRALPTDQFLGSVYNAMLNIPMEEKIETPAAEFASSDEYGLVSYVKTAVWVYLLEAAVGKEKIDLAFHDYFAAWHDKHPQPADMKASFEKTLGTNLDTYFGLLDKTGKLE